MMHFKKTLKKERQVKTMAKKKVQAVSFDDLKKLVVNEAKNIQNKKGK